jgi:hypothetical protein
MRHQKVLIDNIKANDNLSSSWGEIKNWILQGLILEPLFFFSLVYQQFT